MDFQLASFADLEQISIIEKETNEYPWTPNNFKSSLDAGNSSIVLKENKDLEKFIENIDVIEKDLISIFEKNRITKIVARGKKFDPNIHQAMTEVEDEKSEVGTIVQEIQSGYMFGDRLLRPALVGVAKKKDSKIEEKEEKKGEK